MFRGDKTSSDVHFQITVDTISTEELRKHGNKESDIIHQGKGT